MDIIIVALIVLLSSSSARELRPSDHGLIYQTETPSPAENAPSQSGNSSSDMKKFFGGEMNTMSSPELPLPKAMNWSDPAWMNATERRRKAGKGDHVKEVLLVASLVCGITGGVFLLVVGFVFLFRYKNKDHRQVDKPVVEQELQPSPSQPTTTTTDKKISDILSN